MSFHEPFMLHIKWKIAFIRHIKLRKSLPEHLMHKIVHETDCALEQWLLSTATVGVRDTPEFVQACQMHGRFHDEMRHLARLINSGQFGKAEAELDLDSFYEKASLRLAQSLVMLNRAAQSVAATGLLPERAALLKR